MTSWHELFRIIQTVYRIMFNAVIGILRNTQKLLQPSFNTNDAIHVINASRKNCPVSPYLGKKLHQGFQSEIKLRSVVKFYMF